MGVVLRRSADRHSRRDAGLVLVHSNQPHPREPGPESMFRGETMRYTYVAAWSMLGGLSLPVDGDPMELVSIGDCRFVLTRDPDDLLREVDRAAAVGNALLGVLAGVSEGDFASTLDCAIEEAVADRTRKTRDLTMLVFEAQGEVAALLDPQSSAEREEFIVALDAFDKQAVRRSHQPEIEAMKLALAIESHSPPRFTALADAGCTSQTTRLGRPSTASHSHWEGRALSRACR